MSVNEKNKIYMHFRQLLLSPSAKLKMLLSDISVASTRYAEFFALLTEKLLNGEELTGHHGIMSVTVPNAKNNDGSMEAYPVVIPVTDAVNAIVKDEWVKGYRLTKVSAEREIWFEPDDLLNRINREAYSVECFNGAMIAASSQSTNIADTIAVFESSVNSVPNSSDDSTLADIFNGFKIALINAMNTGADAINAVLAYAGCARVDNVTSQEVEGQGLPFDSPAMEYSGSSPIGMWFTNIASVLVSLDWTGLLEAAVSSFIAVAGRVMASILTGGLRLVSLTNQAFTAVESVFVGKNIALSSHGYEDFSMSPGIVKWEMTEEEKATSKIESILVGSNSTAYLAIPTIGCTVYAWRRPGYNTVYMGYRPHLYNQDFSQSVLSMVSRTGNTLSSLTKALQDLPKPTFIPYNGQRGYAISVDNVNNAKAIMMSQRLIPLGLLILDDAVSDINGRYYQDLAQPSLYRDLFVTYKNTGEYEDTTLWTNLRSFNCCNQVPADSLARRMIFRAIMGATSENTFGSSRHTNLQYAIIDEPFSPMWVVPTDESNVASVSEAVGNFGKIALAVIIAAGVYVAVKYFCKVRGLARRAAVQYYSLAAGSADVASVNAAYKKAKRLSVITGIPVDTGIINSSNISSSIMNGFTATDSKESTTHSKIFEISEQLKQVENGINGSLADLLNDVKDKVDTSIAHSTDEIKTEITQVVDLIH